MEARRSNSSCYDSAIEMTPNPSPVPLRHLTPPLLLNVRDLNSSPSSSATRLPSRTNCDTPVQLGHGQPSQAPARSRSITRLWDNKQTQTDSSFLSSLPHRSSEDHADAASVSPFPKRRFTSIKDIKSALSIASKSDESKSGACVPDKDSFYLEPVELKEVSHGLTGTPRLHPSKPIKSKCYKFVPQPAQVHSDYLLPKSFFKNRNRSNQFSPTRTSTVTQVRSPDILIDSPRHSISNNSSRRSLAISPMFGDENEQFPSEFEFRSTSRSPILHSLRREGIKFSRVPSTVSLSPELRKIAEISQPELLTTVTSAPSSSPLNDISNIRENSQLVSRCSTASAKSELNFSPDFEMSRESLFASSLHRQGGRICLNPTLSEVDQEFMLELNDCKVQSTSATNIRSNTSLSSLYSKPASSFPLKKQDMVNFLAGPTEQAPGTLTHSSSPSSTLPSSVSLLLSESLQSSNLIENPQSVCASSNLYPDSPQTLYPDSPHSLASASPSLDSSRGSSMFLFPESSSVDEAKTNVIGHLMEHLFRDMLLLWCRQSQALRFLDHRDTESDRTVYVSRASGEFGFRIHGSRPVVVSAIETDTPAETSGLEVGDIVLSINDVSVLEASHSEVVKLAHSGGCDTLKLEVARTCNLLAPLITTDPTPVCAGYLYKLGAAHRAPGSSAITRRWHRRWFALTKDHCLYHYKSEGDPHPLGAVVLRGHTVHAFSTSSRPYAFTLSVGGEVGLQLAAHTAEARGRWGHVITQASEQAAQRDELLEASARRVQQAPGSIATPDCFGYLHKLGARWHQWKRRYCVLKDACLYLYHDTDATQAIGVVYLHGYRVQSTSIGGKKYAFELLPPESKFRHFYFHAESDYDKKRWLAAFEYSIDRWIKLA